MAIVSSLIRLYASDQVTLLATYPTSGSSTAIPIDGLTAGTEYYVTAQVTDDGGLTSLESPQYDFYTLPDVEYFSAPTASATSIGAQLTGITNDVAIDYYGLAYDTSSSFNNPSYTTPAQQGAVDINGLSEHTTYYVRPYVIDEFGRRWVNTDQRSVTTSYSVPVIAWSGSPTVGSETFSASVNITSTTNITNAYVQYTPQGGSAQTYALSASTGTQSFTLTGLTPNTNYQIRVYATNSGGSGTSTVLNVTTSAASISVAVSNVSVNNTNNVIAATSTATVGTGITITGHYLDLYDNNAHTGVAAETYNGGANAVINNNFSNADPNDTYYVFGRVTYTVSGDANTYTAWSVGYQVDTYSLLSFGTITVGNTDASIPYSVQGTASSVDVSYSTDQTNWTTIPASSMSGGTLSLTSLTPNTTYYLRGRCQTSGLGWQGYVTDNFTTTQVLPVVTVLAPTNVTPISATINLSIS